MRGLTDAEYSELLRLAGPDFDEDFEEDPHASPLVITKRAAVTQFEVYGPDDWAAETTITPLGRLALELWPAIRSGQ